MSIRVLAFSFLTFLLGVTSTVAGADVAIAVREAGDGFIVEATIDAPVALQTAWAVLVDYDHMATILDNLSSSKVASRNGNQLIVKQDGVARFGLFSYPFQVEREIRLEPMTRIRAKNLSGSIKRMESEVRLNAANKGTVGAHRLPCRIRLRLDPRRPVCHVVPPP